MTIGIAALNPSCLALGNGRVLTRAHNLNYQPQSIRDAAAGGLDLAFQYDAVGNLGLFKTAAGINQAQYGYDALNRLTHAKDGATGTPIETYGYDKTGNRTSLLKAGVTTPYTYSTTSHRLGSMGSTVHTYDAAGNNASIGGNAREFVYNNANRLAQVKRLGVVKRDYLYNGKGEQVRSFAGTSNTYTVYDEAGHWLGDFAAPTSPVQQAIWLDDLPIGLLTGAGANQTVQYLQPDHLGSPRVAIDAVANTAIWRWDLKGEAFGNTPPNQDPDGNGQAFVLNLRYPGQRFDAASGLNYNYFRDYDPNTGRYVQSDPIGLEGGISTYSYVGGNPVSRIDPLGLDFLVIGGGVRSWTNPFGHVGLAITGHGMFSYGNSTPLGSSVTDYIQSQSQSRNQLITLIPATAAQDAAAAYYLALNHPGMNDVGKLDNCAVRTNEGLMAGGKPSLQSPFPGGLSRAAGTLPGAQTFFIPQGGPIPAALLNILPSFNGP